jgi:SAM-dependent methyltransferase
MPPSAPSPAEAHESYFVPAMFRPWAELLLDAARLVPGERVLDVACGTGIVARTAVEEVGPEGQVTGLDLNPAMLAVARSRDTAARIRWVEGSAQALPFPAASFDVVLCQHGLQFFPDRVQALREMRRVLVPGGRALVMVLQSIDRHPVFLALMEAVASELGLPLAQVAIPFAVPDAETLAAIHGSAGFRGGEVVPVDTEVRFDDPARFVPMAVASSAAAVPAFAQLTPDDRAALLARVGEATAPALAGRVQDGQLVFTMHGLVFEGRA